MPFVPQRTFAAGALILALLLSACATGRGPATGGPGPTPPSGPPSTAPPATAKKPALGGELVSHIISDPDSLHPLFYRTAYAATVLDGVFGCGLVRLDETLEPEACLAKSFSSSADGLEWTFPLRTDVKFHDGTPLTAADVEYTYGLLLSPDYTGRFRTSVAPIKEVRALDAQTVRFTLKEPFAPFLFSAAGFSIVPKHLLQNVPIKDQPGHDYAKHPIGTGPYKFVEWKPGQFVTLTAFTDWFKAKDGEGPFVQTWRLKVIGEQNTSIAALENGEIDIYTSMAPDHVDRFRRDFADKLKAYDWDRNGFGYLTLNTENWPTSDPAVRQALHAALNRPAIVAGILQGKATVPQGPIPPVSWAFDASVKGYGYDPKAAQGILEKAGYKRNAGGLYEKDGRPLKLQYFATAGNALIEGIALQAQKDWRAIGVETDVKFVEFNTLIEKHMQPGDFHITFSGFSLGADPDTFYGIFHSKAAEKNEQGLVLGNNAARYRNPAVDKLLEDARKTTDIGQRKRIYSDFQRTIINDSPHIWVYANQYTDFAADKLKGVVNLKGYGATTGFVHRWYITEK